MFKPRVLRFLAPVSVVALVMGACLPFLGSGPIGNPMSPQSASASSPEQLARASVPTMNAVGQAAAVGEFIPGLNVPATVVDRFARGYLDEITRQINGLDARLQASLNDPSKRPPDRSDWMWAIALATGAGGLNVFSFRQGQKAKPGASA